jgi:hypothetical protein
MFYEQEDTLPVPPSSSCYPSPIPTLDPMTIIYRYNYDLLYRYDYDCRQSNLVQDVRGLSYNQLRTSSKYYDYNAM